MASSVNANLLNLLQNSSQVYSGKGRFINNQLNPLNKQSANLNQQTNNNNFNLNLSSEGISALQSQESTANIDTSIFTTNKELSPKAQAFLEKLQKDYGDNYDFIVADNVDDPQALASGSNKNYSVIFSSDELEAMANDEEYASSMLSKLDEAVKSAENIMENAQLDGKAQFSQIAVSFDNDGNQKIFATLEKLSESQQERIDAAKEKRAEESAQTAEQPQTFSISADDEKGLLESLFNVNWDKVFVS